MCLPGDIGWIIEADERPMESWEMAKAECLKFGMRLPEPFEFLFSCTNAEGFGLLSSCEPRYRHRSDRAL
ncbi:MAG: hypothetical protein ETSY2_03630 [Candidatus Entotheonella gemina]|uniref:Uncharacterized protein n=1 Tax=Candidatus Entotheonella gemina TaxID=1429439 RepID=W4MGC9_9BACT|nr:MAG: hypothetical protein ETSY2_03630 [Candidatus Entotheonella gemina]